MVINVTNCHSVAATAGLRAHQRRDCHLRQDCVGEAGRAPGHPVLYHRVQAQCGGPGLLAHHWFGYDFLLHDQ